MDENDPITLPPGFLVRFVRAWTVDQAILKCVRGFGKRPARHEV
jgi:hypothetical protein